MHNPMPIVWSFFKTLVSIGVLICGFSIVYFSVQERGLFNHYPWVTLLLTLFIAAAPWVFGQTRPSIGTEIAFLCMGCGLIYFALSVPYVPENCNEAGGRSRASCVLFNWVYSLGGSAAVASIFMAFGVLIILASAATLRKRLKNA